MRTFRQAKDTRNQPISKTSLVTMIGVHPAWDPQEGDKNRGAFQGEWGCICVDGVLSGLWRAGDTPRVPSHRCLEGEARGRGGKEANPRWDTLCRPHTSVTGAVCSILHAHANQCCVTARESETQTKSLPLGHAASEVLEPRSGAGMSRSRSWCLYKALGPFRARVCPQARRTWPSSAHPTCTHSITHIPEFAVQPQGERASQAISVWS